MFDAIFGGSHLDLSEEASYVLSVFLLINMSIVILAFVYIRSYNPELADQRKFVSLTKQILHFQATRTQNLIVKSKNAALISRRKLNKIVDKCSHGLDLLTDLENMETNHSDQNAPPNCVLLACVNFLIGNKPFLKELYFDKKINFDEYMFLHEFIGNFSKTLIQTPQRRQSDEDVILNVFKQCRVTAHEFRVSDSPIDTYLLETGQRVDNIPEIESLDFESILNEAKLDGVAFQSQKKVKKKHKFNFDLTALKPRRKTAVSRNPDLTPPFCLKSAKNSNSLWVRVKDIKLSENEELLEKIRHIMELTSLPDIRLSEVLSSDDDSSIELAAGRLYLKTKFNIANLLYARNHAHA